MRYARKTWIWGAVALIIAALAIGCVNAGPMAKDLKPVVPVAQAQDSGVELTVYNQNLALVRDLRDLELEAGVNEIKFTEVAALIDPTSVRFRSLTDPAGTYVMEQNYEYDVVGTSKLLQKYVDQQITVVTEDGTMYEGYLLSGAQDLILGSSASGGAVSVVKLSTVREIKFPSLPEGLLTKPTLVWKVQAEKAGTHQSEVTYMTNGINWYANYVAVINEKDDGLSLNGWVTLDNQSGATYENAKLKLIAGDVNRVTAARDERVYAVPTAAPSGVEKGFVEQSFFEYHLYTLQRPATIKDQQTKQIEFTGTPAVTAAKFYVYDGAQMGGWRYYSPVMDQGYGTQSNPKVYVMLEFVNAATNGLGIPLPKGVVRVYKENPEGGAEFIGEDQIDHTPKDERILLHLGDAFDLVGERKQTNFTRPGDRTIEESYEIKLRNHKDEAVEIRVVEQMFRWSEWTILQSSHEYEKKDSRTIEFRIPVPKDGEATVTYTVRYRW
ncbi:MAG: DUF4139 domain-containing protein [Chloroflexi bacterium]|nr:DUF4139 domain-containing protein [Chloroflexota bacterium]MBU1747365.1 DUF4139 domain-containing protein [Chloroflexota bacterium]